LIRNPRPTFRAVSIALVVLGSVLATAIPSSAADDPFVWTGSRQWDVAQISSDVVGTGGPLYKFNVKTEVDVSYDADQFASEVLATLSDQRSWVGNGGYRFQLVAGGSTEGLASDSGVQFTLYLATPATVDALCSPVRTVGKLSCRNGNRVVENFHRWMRGPDVYHSRFDGALNVYRNYLVNHEVGHRIGKAHQNITNCRADLYAPVMMQQTFDVRGCAINGWPAYDLLTVGTEPKPEPPAPPPSGPCDPTEVFPWTVTDRSLDDSVTRLYRAAFGRAPDVGGQTYWVEQRATDQTLGDLAASFLDSPEGVERFGSSGNEIFIDNLYSNVLGRNGDLEGRTFWLGQLEMGTSRAVVLTEFSESPENIERTATSPPQPSEHGWLARAYEAIFQRVPDCEGVRYWLWAPMGRAQIVDVFIDGPEFENRYGNTTDDEFVDLLYRNVLGREPDLIGAEHWIGELSSGRSTRSEVVLLWLATPEFIIATGTTP